MILNTFQTFISRQSISKIIKDLGWTRKKVKKRGKSVNKPLLLERFKEKLKTFDCETKILCIDETGFDFRATPIYGYSRKGTPCILEYIPRNDKVRYNVIMTISNQQHNYLQYTIHRDYVNKQMYSDYLKNIEIPRNSVIIMDNASIHKGKEIMNTIEKRDSDIIFTPPYSPECNPIELIFGKIKTRFYNLKYKHKDTKLEDLIVMAINSVTMDDVHNSISHVVNSF